MACDPITLIENAYRPAPDALAWLRAHARAIIEPFDVDALGALSYFMQGFEPQEIGYEASGDLDLGAATVQELVGRSYASVTSVEMMQRTLLAIGAPGVHTLVETIGGVMPVTHELLPMALSDSPAVMIPTGDGRVGVVATITHQPQPIDVETHALWERVALHLAAACRLAGRAADPEADDVEAVVDPGGRVRHARGAAQSARAREQLRDAARQMDAARTRKGRADAMKALDLWQGLLAGRWSLVDHFDTDGRRFLLARQNDPDAPTAGTLARRQRQVAFYASVGWSLKQIGFALGLAESTVSRHLSLALDKLGMRSRADLVRITSEMARVAAIRMLSPRA
jgi:DNA-binding NarL/FixJ family response regulator